MRLRNSWKKWNRNNYTTWWEEAPSKQVPLPIEPSHRPVLFISLRLNLVLFFLRQPPCVSLADLEL